MASRRLGFVKVRPSLQAEIGGCKGVVCGKVAPS
jgi:hypothetical protein